MGSYVRVPGSIQHQDVEGSANKQKKRARQLRSKFGRNSFRKLRVIRLSILYACWYSSVSCDTSIVCGMIYVLLLAVVSCDALDRAYAIDEVQTSNIYKCARPDT